MNVLDLVGRHAELEILNRSSVAVHDDTTQEASRRVPDVERGKGTAFGGRDQIRRGRGRGCRGASGIPHAGWRSPRPAPAGGPPMPIASKRPGGTASRTPRPSPGRVTRAAPRHSPRRAGGNLRNLVPSRNASGWTPTPRYRRRTSSRSAGIPGKRWPGGTFSQAQYAFTSISACRCRSGWTSPRKPSATSGPRLFGTGSRQCRPAAWSSGGGGG